MLKRARDSIRSDISRYVLNMAIEESAITFPKLGRCDAHKSLMKAYLPDREGSFGSVLLGAAVPPEVDAAC